MKTREDIENLKMNWQKDPIWDIEDTEGFEEYKDELLAYKKECEKEWDKREKERKKHQAAFPIRNRWDSSQEGWDLIENGMELRDYFAAQALMGSLSGMNSESHITSDSIARKYAEEAYLLADAMLEEREK